ncbi:protein NOI4-like isoform X1 [Triticum dicoccoides]|uniref:RIN4 pathogenic type III effector avirulence factor Avr cleavage site domain-containing protein n=2 Tax=Triticum urartu TaxID=4572 RepID=A0A8R7QR58_TRIUA|nr:protein NOI4-like isoform X1 [Triticum dicoccoides]XP_044404150.1 protein NOI4-like isoform X1 [Triticum aestivum]
MSKMAQMEAGRTIPKFGAWDVNNPASADGFTVIFSKARDDKKAPVNVHKASRSADGKDARPDSKMNQSYSNSRPNTSKKWFCCVSPSPTQP